MAKEIERKYLVKGDAWRKLAQGVHYRQGYLNSTKERTVRIRTVGEKAVITVKGPTIGVTRMEFEYPIPFRDCVTMLENLAEQPIIEKTRYIIPGKSMNSLAPMPASSWLKLNCQAKTRLLKSPTGLVRKYPGIRGTSIPTWLRIPSVRGKSEAHHDGYVFQKSGNHCR